MPLAVPSHTCPLPWALPKLDPEIVMMAPTGPLVGVMLAIVDTGIVKGSEFDAMSVRRTCTVPVRDPVDTFATTSASFHDPTPPDLPPTHTATLLPPKPPTP